MAGNGFMTPVFKWCPGGQTQPAGKVISLGLDKTLLLQGEGLLGLCDKSQDAIFMSGIEGLIKTLWVTLNQINAWIAGCCSPLPLLPKNKIK